MEKTARHVPEGRRERRMSEKVGNEEVRTSVLFWHVTLSSAHHSNERWWLWRRVISQRVFYAPLIFFCGEKRLSKLRRS